MIKNRDSLKAQIANLSAKVNIPNQYLIQNFMFEALIRRISVSKYKHQFIIKGGFLLSSIFGVDLRSTMDLDTTIRGFSLDRDTLTKIITEIISCDVHDNISIELVNIKDIRFDDEYSGYCVNLLANYDGLKTNLMIDITTGDVITFKEVEYKYKTLLTDEVIKIMAYNLETIISEKFLAIISRNVDNTRMKDYYDIYMFTKLKWQEVQLDILKNAIINTANNKHYLHYVLNSNLYIEMIEKDKKLKKLWDVYRNNYSYAEKISFEEVIQAVKIVNDILENEEE